MFSIMRYSTVERILFSAKKSYFDRMTSVTNVIFLSPRRVVTSNLQSVVNIMCSFYILYVVSFVFLWLHGHCFRAMVLRP